ncbi:flagellin N-terminal helical domain-containing protein [Stakelama tenebrarum]|uniref:Flagellin n=1 Tax=Stakelama tenebrarum TaxID=2711215 RepID=A0A6G6Y4M0_9SPHN|nr:flagellin [Sphingosinithalassobacter tenebrarum]QIG79668.1 flagellin [Sphingosinithalassobacter tenebrarum]
MTRVATIPLQRTMADAIGRSQEKLAITQVRLSTGKKATDFADLGTEAVRNLSTHSMLAKQQATASVAKRVGTTLDLYQGHIEMVSDTASTLRTTILAAIGTGQSAGLQADVEAAFDQFRNSLNASEGGKPLFAGSQTGSQPFRPMQLSDLDGLDAADAFRDDGVMAKARVDDNVDVTYGIGASQLGGKLFDAFRTLAEGGKLGSELTEDQKTMLSRAAEQLSQGMEEVTSVNAANGRRQAQVETLATRGEARALVLQGVIEDNEDADLGQVAIDLAQQKAVLEASYSVFSQLSKLSLLNYL